MGWESRKKEENIEDYSNKNCFIVAIFTQLFYLYSEFKFTLKTFLPAISSG